MTPNGWTKRQYKLFLSSAVVYALSVFIPIGIAASADQLQSRRGLLITLLVIVASLFLAQVLAKRDNYLLSRTLKMEYAVAEYDFRMALKYKAIPYTHKLDEPTASHRFDFPSHNLQLTLSPYDLVNGIVLGTNALAKQIIVESQGVLVTIEGIDANNRPFADRLVAAVNTVDEQYKRRLNA